MPFTLVDLYDLDERTDPNRKPGLFRHFPPQSLLDGFTRLDSPSGQGPRPLERCMSAPYQTNRRAPVDNR